MMNDSALPSRTKLQLPIFQFEIWNSTELSCIVRYQDQPVLKGDRGDLQIMRADHRANFFEFMSDHRAFPRAIIIERQRNERLENISNLPCSRTGLELRSAP